MWLHIYVFFFNPNQILTQAVIIALYTSFKCYVKMCCHPHACYYYFLTTEQLTSHLNLQCQE